MTMQCRDVAVVEAVEEFTGARTSVRGLATRSYANGPGGVIQLRSL